MKVLFLLITAVSMAFSQTILEGDLLNALEGSSWGDEYQTKPEPSVPGVSREPVDPQDTGTRTSTELNCNNKEDQTTVPYRFLLGLIANRGIDIAHDPHNGTLKLNAGIMIGNCNSMLETVVAKPVEGADAYTYQMAVKKPDDCSNGKCNYTVTTIESGKNVKRKGLFSPDFTGFVNCLKATGVYSGGKIVKDKIAPVEYIHEARDITMTKPVVYANRGFKNTTYAGKFSKNKYPEHAGCYYFEDLQVGGFSAYSVDDMENYELSRLFQKVCNSGNYKLINNHISDFDELGGLQRSLIDIRNDLIMEEVKSLAEVMNESSDLADVDKARFKEVISDYLEFVVKPLKNDLAQLQRLYANPGHTQKEKILKSVYGPNKAEALLGKGPKELKEILKKDMDEMSGKLVAYAREPYLTNKHYQKMQNKEKKAPLDNKTWTSAILDLYEIHNTAFNYGRYNDDFYDSHYKDNEKYKNENRYAAGSELDQKIAAKVKAKGESLGRIYSVASNPDQDHVKEYKEKKTEHLAVIDKQIREYQKKIMEARRKVQTGCAMEKAQKYWISQQACVRDAAEVVEACTKRLEALMKERGALVKKYDGQIAKWEDAQGKTGKKTSGKKVSTNSTFDFNPNSSGAQNPYVQNNAYSQQLLQMQYQMMMRNQNPNWMNQGGGFNFNAGFGPTSGYRYPAMSGVQGMYPNMGYYGQNYSRPGGIFNFGMSGGLGAGYGYGGGLPQSNYWNPAYSPMAPMGAQAGFNFGP